MSIDKIFLLTIAVIFGIIHIRLIVGAITGILACLFLLFYQMGIDTLYLMFNMFGVVIKIEGGKQDGK